MVQDKPISVPLVVGPTGRVTRQRMAGLVLLGLLLLALVPVSVVVGAQPTSFGLAWDAITAFDPGNSQHLVVVHLRIPRTLLAMITGAGLGVAGAIMQALTRNPLADPGLFGVNAGAAAAVAAAIAFLGTTSVTAYMGFGLLGAGLASVVIYVLGDLGRSASPVRVVLAGAALTAVLLSLTQIILINSEEQVFNQFRHWTVGSLQGRGYAVLGPVAMLTGIGLALALALARLLDAAALGQDLARALGVNPALVWALAAIAVIILAGSATAAAGPIAFIGLTAPHLARFITGPSHRWLLPYAVLVSAVLMLAADILGRLIAPPGEIGVGIMVALMGGPFFIAMVRRRRIAKL